MSYHFDTLIIGSGIAGLNLARKLAQAGQSVFICSKEAVTEGSSKYAQGGVAVVSPWNPEDKLESHIQDTIRAGKGLANSEVVEKVLSSSWKRVEEFIGLGVDFDKDFNLEGSHSFKRVLHVADATGRALMKPLLDNVSCNFNVSISQGTEALSLIKSEDKVVGADLRTVSGENIRIIANNTVLASGGFASLYNNHTTPNILTGDGHMLAYDAGAELENLEFVQFHPTVFFTDDKCFLISEVVRGAGATLKNINGEAFMQNYDKRAELATRDVVSRSIEAEMKRTNSDFVYLDMTCWSSEEIEAKFPNINHFCNLRGFDLSKEMLPVKPAAHYSVGGVKTDIHGKTSVEGLYALGEVASTGLHGANRLASNSLLECIVMPEFIANDILNSPNVNEKLEDIASNVSLDICSSYIEQYSYESENIKQENLEKVRNILSKAMGLVRSEDQLKEALISLENLKDFKATRLARLIISSALNRKESRGCHFREDFPEMNEVASSISSKQASQIV
ncbi:MAG: L-aspartate oxidase [Candidatus Caenarcaniphilales bacterium]|nr:L-aspartate oxidase [Candidatus Caenarcaniphilales bacterium]